MYAYRWTKLLISRKSHPKGRVTFSLLGSSFCFNPNGIFFNWELCRFIPGNYKRKRQEIPGKLTTKLRNEYIESYSNTRSHYWNKFWNKFIVSCVTIALLKKNLIVSNLILAKLATRGLNNNVRCIFIKYQIILSSQSHNSACLNPQFATFSNISLGFRHKNAPSVNTLWQRRT